MCFSPGKAQIRRGRTFSLDEQRSLEEKGEAAHRATFVQSFGATVNFKPILQSACRSELPEVPFTFPPSPPYSSKILATEPRGGTRWTKQASDKSGSSSSRLPHNRLSVSAEFTIGCAAPVPWATSLPWPTRGCPLGHDSYKSVFAFRPSSMRVQKCLDSARASSSEEIFER